jgi:hypothetical protein
MHAVGIEIFLEIDAEAIALEFVSDVSGVIDLLPQGRVGVRIFRIADDKSVSVPRRQRRRRRHDRENKCEEQYKAGFHATAAQQKRRRHQLAPRRRDPA